MSEFVVRITTPLGVRYYDDALLSDFKKSSDKTDNFCYDFKEKIDGKLTFTKQEYGIYKTIDTSQLRYMPMYIKVWQKCEGENELIVDGRLSFMESEFDDDKCTIKVKCVTKNKYLKFDQDKGNTYNLIRGFNGEFFTKYKCTHTDIVGVIRNGILLSEALTMLYKQIHPSNYVISNFLGIGGYAGQYPYNRILLYQKSDVVRRNIPSYSPALVMEASLEKLLNIVCQQFNLLYKIDDLGNLWIDDLYYFVYSLPTNNFTLPPRSIQIAGMNRYTYKIEQIFKRELFTNVGSVNDDFVGMPVVYDNALVNELDKDAENKIDVDVYTDVPYLCSLDPYDERVDYNGIVLIAADNSGTILDTGGVTYLDPVVKPNNVLGWAVLHPNRFKDFGRLFSKGYMNGLGTTFTNIQKTKQQKDLKIKLCCGDDFNVNGFMQTEQGIGIAESFKYDFGKRVMTLDLLFEPNDSDLVVVPICYDDFYITDMGVVVDTVTMALPTLVANDSLTAGSYVLAENKPTMYGGTVQIFSDGSFFYTQPSPTFVGQDFFDYTVIDANNYSAVGQVTITTRWGNVHVKDIVEYFDDTQDNPGGYFITVGTAKWFKDIGGTQPLDVTGYGFDLLYQDNTPTPLNVLAHGFQQEYLNDTAAPFTYVLAILPSPDYTII